MLLVDIAERRQKIFEFVDSATTCSHGLDNQVWLSVIKVCQVTPTVKSLNIYVCALLLKAHFDAAALLASNFRLMLLLSTETQIARVHGVDVCGCQTLLVIPLTETVIIELW